MLIGAALQWANKVVLIGGQGHISRTYQTEASAAFLSNCKQTHTHMYGPWTNSGICFSAAVQGRAGCLVVFYNGPHYLSAGIPHSPWLCLRIQWLHMDVWVLTCVFASPPSCMPQMSQCQWKGKFQTCEGQTHQAQEPVRIEKHKSLHLHSRLRTGLGLLTTEQWTDCCADNVMFISNAFSPLCLLAWASCLLLTVWEMQGTSMPSSHEPGGSRVPKDSFLSLLKSTGIEGLSWTLYVSVTMVITQFLVFISFFHLSGQFASLGLNGDFYTQPRI